MFIHKIEYEVDFCEITWKIFSEIFVIWRKRLSQKYVYYDTASMIDFNMELYKI